MGGGLGGGRGGGRYSSDGPLTVIYRERGLQNPLSRRILKSLAYPNANFAIGVVNHWQAERIGIGTSGTILGFARKGQRARVDVVAAALFAIC